jgi:hypothetical protein
MKNRFSFPILLGILFVISCKKDNNTPPDSSSLPKTYTEDIRSSGFNSLTVYNLSYDGNNRLVSIVAIPEPSIGKIIYQYANDNSFTMDLYNSNVLDIHEKFWLNSISFVDSTFQFNSTNDTSTEKYIYNSAKQLIQRKDYTYYSAGPVLDNVTDYTYDNNGNVTEESDNLGKTVTYEYYPDLTNNLSTGQVYLPVPKNFIKTASTNSGGTLVTATHFYTFDSNNRLTKDSASTNVDVIVIKSYTY